MHVDSSWNETGRSPITFLISSLLYAEQLQASINKAKNLKKSKSKHFDVRVVVEMSSKRCQESPRILKGKLLYWNNPANEQIFSSEVYMWKNKKLFRQHSVPGNSLWTDIIEIGKMSKINTCLYKRFVVGGNFVAVEVKDKMAICDEQNRLIENELKATIWT